MSETNVPYGSGPGAPGAGASQDTGGSGSAATGIKERAGEAASHVGDAGRDVAQDAKDRARSVAHEATDRARGLVDQTRTELSEQARTQQDRLAGGLRTLGAELRQMADGTEDPGYATDVVRRVGDATGQVAQWFEDREPASVLHEVEDFARRRPGTFLLLAAGAGLLVGRLVRGMKDAPDTGDGSQERGGVPTSSTRGAHAAPVTTGAAETAAGGPGVTGGAGVTGGTGTTGVTGGTGATAPAGTTGTPAGGAPDIGTAGAFPGLANERLAQDPDVATSAEGERPPSFRPTTSGTGADRPGGGPDVVHP